jgi:DNA-binding transcriptional LysR family regulator
MSRRIDLYTLRLFVSAAREGSIARAAEVEHIAPSALSRRISELEHVLGLPLLIRSPRGIELTDAGKTVFAGGARIDRDLDQLARDVHEQSGQTSGTVRLFANSSSIVGFLPERLKAFRESFPLVEVSLRDRTTAEVIRACLDDRADVGVAVKTHVSSGVDSWFFAEDPLVLVLPQGHPLAKKHRLRYADVLPFPMIGMQAGGSLDQLLQERAVGAGVAPTINMFVNSFDAVCRLAEAGLGIAIVPTSIVAAYGRNQPFVCRKLDEPWVRREIYLYALRKNPRPRSVEALIDALRGRISDTK